MALGKPFIVTPRGRYWERTYPHSDWHGGGPPCLTNITFDAAKEKYKVGN